MAGTIVADTLTHSTAGSIATNYVVNGSAKMWCNFSQSGTPSAYGSFNVSSLSDLGVGVTGLNYTNVMSGTNDVVANTTYQRSNTKVNQNSTSLASRVAVYNSDRDGGGFEDGANIGTIVHGDLA